MDLSNKQLYIRYRGFTAKVEPVNNWEKVYAAVEGISPKLEVYAVDVVVLQEEFKKMIDKFLDETKLGEASVNIADAIQIELSEQYLGLLNYIADDYGITLKKLICKAFEECIEEGLAIIAEEIEGDIHDDEILRTL